MEQGYRASTVETFRHHLGAHQILGQQPERGVIQFRLIAQGDRDIIVRDHALKVFDIIAVYLLPAQVARYFFASSSTVACRNASALAAASATNSLISGLCRRSRKAFSRLCLNSFPSSVLRPFQSIKRPSAIA